MPKPHDPVRAEVRRLYVESHETLEEIAARFALHLTTIVRWAREGGWPRRGRGTGKRRRLQAASAALVTTPASLAVRLKTVILHNLIELEQRMASDDPLTPAELEASTRAITTTVRNLEKVNELEPASSRTRGEEPKSGGNSRSEFDEEEQLRVELVDRLVKLRQRRRAESGPAGGDPPA